MRVIVLAIALGLAAPARGAEAPGADWLSGYWLSCAGGVQTAQTWLGAGSGVMLGVNVERKAGARVSFEHLRIGPGAQGLAFFGAPSGTAAVEFPVKTIERQGFVFENPAHDFPQRVSFRRQGEMLHARIEGHMDGRLQAFDWTFHRAPHDAACHA
jgi:hypothetical protein